MNINDGGPHIQTGQDHRSILHKSISKVSVGELVEIAQKSPSGNPSRNLIKSEDGDVDVNPSSLVSDTSLGKCGSVVEELLDIVNEHVGRIIGRGGQTIRDIQMRSGATLKVPQESQQGESFRRIHICGSLEQVQNCLLLVKLQLPSTSQSEITDLQKKIETMHIENEKALVIENVKVPTEHVGRLIGKGGLCLRLLQQMTGATITLPRFQSPGSTNQIFTITGDKFQVLRCYKMLHAKIAEFESSNFAKPNRGVKTYAVVLGGAAHMQMPLGSYSPLPLHNYPIEPTFGYTTDGMPAVHVDDVLYIRIRDNVIGRVIGKQGNAIKDFQRKSGALIFLPRKNIHGTGFREMQVVGTMIQRVTCLELLMESVPLLGPGVISREIGEPVSPPNFALPLWQRSITQSMLYRQVEASFSPYDQVMMMSPDAPYPVLVNNQLAPSAQQQMQYLNPSLVSQIMYNM